MTAITWAGWWYCDGDLINDENDYCAVAIDHGDADNYDYAEEAGEE